VAPRRTVGGAVRSPARVVATSGQLGKQKFSAQQNVGGKTGMGYGSKL